MKRVVEKHANAFLTSAKAKGAGKLNFVFQIVLGDLFLKQLNYLPRAFDMAGTSDTNGDFHDSVISFLVLQSSSQSSHVAFRIIYSNYTKFADVCQAKKSGIMQKC